MRNEQVERWYSMKEISEYLSITRYTSLAWIERRDMSNVKVEHTGKFNIGEIGAWMKSEGSRKNASFCQENN